jgi:type 2 lantibiotic biosynthesis protein LanM
VSNHGAGFCLAIPVKRLMNKSPGFLTLLSPQIAEARARLRTGIQAVLEPHEKLIWPAPAVLENMFFAGVSGPLERMVTPTLALEINVARLRDQLAGATAEERFNHFVQLLSDPEYSTTLADEYPVLFDLTMARLNTWVDASLEFLTRLVTDWPTIRKKFFDGAPPIGLTGLRWMQRSTKRRGRSVITAIFDSGAKIVYKPRSLAIEDRFQAFLAWMNRTGFEPVFPMFQFLDCHTHGWMEWIDPSDCSTTAELRRFYRRQGAYLALFYALEATDVHMSNVIAAGEHPVLIDLEALFHPRDTAPDWPTLELILDETLAYSVLRPGLLPEPETAADDDPDRFDISALAGAGGQRTPYSVVTWHNKGTDALSLKAERKIISASKNLPRLSGQPVHSFDYLDDLDEGFTAAYRLLAEHKGELLAAGSPLARFAGAEIRFIPRSGRRYRSILEASYHPDLLRAPEARSHFVAQRLREEAGDDPDLDLLLAHEEVDLLAGDSPLFAAQTDGRDVVTSRGHTIPDFLTNSGLEMARQRVAALGEADLARQRWLIRASFAMVVPENFGTTRAFWQRPPSPTTDLAAQALAEARNIGEWLEHTTIQAGVEASWIGLESEGLHWSVEPVGDYLASGLPGIALFLAYLAESSTERRWSSLARAAMVTYRRHMAEDREDQAGSATGQFDAFDEPIGLLDGIGGQLIALVQLASMLEPEAREEIDHLINRAAVRLLDNDEIADPGLAWGLAGLLTGLLAANTYAPESAALAVACVVGDLLIFRLPGAPINLPDAPLAAFFHGPAGAIGPLLALAEMAGMRRYRVEACKRLKGLIASPFDAGLWRAYLFARPWLHDDETRDRLDARLRSELPALLDERLGYNHSLGSGDWGYIDMTLIAGKALDDTCLLDCAERHAGAVLDDMRRNGLKAAVPLQIETPGLMAGLAGIGYGLLRVAAPEIVAPFPALGLPVRTEK